MNNSFLTDRELSDVGFKSIGSNVLISRAARFYGAENISIGSNVRIDDFCIISGVINIGDYVHVAPYSSLCGGVKGVTVKNFVNISRKVEVFAVSDDFTGETMTNPMVPAQFKSLIEEPVIMNEHVLIGAGSVILPGVVLAEGSVIGALSLVKDSTDPWTINSGIPSLKRKERSKNLLFLEKKLLASDYEN